MKLLNNVRRIVLHHSLTSGGSVDTFREWHTKINGWEDIGYHFVIHKNGLVEKGRDLDFQGAHAFGKNKDSIGICLIGDFFKEEPTEDQYNKSASLYASLCQMYGKLKINFHRKVPSYDKLGRNDCPGPLLDRKKIMDMSIKRAEQLGVFNV